MILRLGFGLAFLGGFSLFLMHVTQSVPRSGWWPVMRHEDPDAYDDWWIASATLAGAGAVLAAAAALFGL